MSYPVEAHNAAILGVSELVDVAEVLPSVSNVLHNLRRHSGLHFQLVYFPQGIQGNKTETAGAVFLVNLNEVHQLAKRKFTHFTPTGE